MSESEQFGRHIDIGAAQLFVWRWGAGERAVVCWHALGVLRTGRAMEEAAPALAEWLNATGVRVRRAGLRPLAAGTCCCWLSSFGAGGARRKGHGRDGIDEALWLGQS
jgi:hypothetical protein